MGGVLGLTRNPSPLMLKGKLKGVLDGRAKLIRFLGRRKSRLLGVSVMLDVIRANTNATTIMIVEKVGAGMMGRIKMKRSNQIVVLAVREMSASRKYADAGGSKLC